MLSGQKMLIDLEAQTKCFVALQSTCLRSKYKVHQPMQQQLSAKNFAWHTTDPNTGHSGEAQSRNKEQKNQSSS